MVVCKDFAEHVQVLNAMAEAASEDYGDQDTRIDIVRVKPRYTEPTSSGWADIMVNFVFCNDAHKHICELQVVHEKMLLLRQGGGGHTDYNKSRAAMEFLEFTLGEEEAIQLIDEISSTVQRSG